MQYRKADDLLKDPRSQCRKRLRAALLASDKPFECAKCGWAPTPPLTRTNNLDANHISKDIYDCDPANGEWLCRLHHKQADMKTEKGVSPVGETMGYDLEAYGL